MKHTPLYETHVKLNAKMGAFAGYDMPLYYSGGVVAEHEWVRSRAGIFDVSHMGQILIEGPGATEFLERLTPSSFATMPEGRARYTVMTNPQGGIVDDLIVTRRGPDKYFAVINAGCKDKDIAWIAERLPGDTVLTRLDDRALIALQGPQAEAVLREALHIDTEGMPYMWMIDTRFSGDTPLYVSRVGYTGEDGFELSMPANAAGNIWLHLSRHGAVRPIGLAARDSLRLDMGYCLYGHDIDDSTTPVEAGLSWVMGKNNTGFTGADRVLAQLAQGPQKLRVGIRLTEKGIAREGTQITASPGGPAIGSMTSGGFSPSLKQGIGLGYVEASYAAPGTPVFAEVRGRAIAADIVVPPFVKARTKSMKIAA